MIFIAGTATVYATTSVSFDNNIMPEISGVAGITEGLKNELKLEMEIVGLKPNALYVAKIDYAACREHTKETVAAAFITANNYGSYSTVMKGMPGAVKTAQSVTLYSAHTQTNLEEVYCIDLG